nr:hypothetical protein [Myxococcota bacterium]
NEAPEGPTTVATAAVLTTARVPPVPARAVSRRWIAVAGGVVALGLSAAAYVAATSAGDAPDTPESSGAPTADPSAPPVDE